MDHDDERLGHHLAINKKLIRWHAEFAANGTAIPAEARRLGGWRFWLSRRILAVVSAAVFDGGG